MGRRSLVKGGELIVMKRSVLTLQAGGEPEQLSVKPVRDQGRDQKLTQPRDVQPGETGSASHTNASGTSQELRSKQRGLGRQLHTSRFRAAAPTRSYSLVCT